jgi:phytoene dehydrogenase-like protein
MTAEKKIIIIGAGLGGLATGVYAQLNGFNTTIYEQHKKAGGLAATWKRGQYLIDGGIHFLTGHKPGIDFYRILNELGITNDNYSFIDMKTYCRVIDEQKNNIIDITCDLEKLRTTLTENYSDDEILIDKIINGSIKFSKYDLTKFGFDKPQELISKKDYLRNAWKVKTLTRYFSGDYNSSISNFTKDTKNKSLRNFLISIFMPQVPVWFIMMILGSLSSNQMCLLGEGSYQFAKRIEDRFKELKGKIHYLSEIKLISTQNDKVTGVVLANDELKEADYVVSAVDGYHTIYQLLEGRYTNKTIEERYRNLKVVPPYIVVSFGVNREFSDPWLNIIKTNRPVDTGGKQISELAIRIFNYSPFFSPPKKTVIQIMVETDWDFWATIRKNKSQYNETKENIATDILTRLEKYYPGITQQIEVTDVATPYTYWRYTRSSKGSIMGFLPSAKDMLSLYKKSLPGLDNFYMAGQWSLPIGGVQTAIFSGRHAIQLICKKEKKKFSNKLKCP